MEGARAIIWKSFGASLAVIGDDPLAYAPTGFIWDHVLLHGLSFRNYGEMARTEMQPRDAKFVDIFEDHNSKAGKISFEHTIQIETLRRYSCPNAPGWNMRIPDAIRADVFLKEFANYEKQGDWPTDHHFLPSDHTSGTGPGGPAARASCGRDSPWVASSNASRKAVIGRRPAFSRSDDPQARFDHVDRHARFCLVASPYTKRGAVVSKFYNQTSVLHTMSRGSAFPNEPDGRVVTVDDRLLHLRRI
jgi:hypothetical protein